MTTPHHPDIDVLVVGAGIAGLTAAHRLTQAGHRVRVLEAEPHVGGRMRTVEWEGFRLDPGAQFFTGADRKLLALTHELGLDDEVSVRFDDGIYFAIHRDGETHPVNFLSIGNYLRWKGVSLRARLAMLKLLPHLVRHLRGDVYHLERGPGKDVESFEAFFRRRISDEMFDYWAHPTFETNCSYGGDDLSRKAFVSLLAGYLNEKSFVFRNGMGTLPTALAARLDVATGVRVRRVVPGDDRAEVHCDNQVLAARRVVIATPGIVVPTLLDPLPSAWADLFSRVRYPTVTTQFHVVDHPAFDPGTAPADGVMLPAPEPGFAIAFIYFVQRQDNRWLVMTEPKAHTSRLDEDPAIALDRAWDDVTRVYPELAGRRVAARQFPWPAKVPAFPAGYLDALARFWSDPGEDPLFVCGDYLAGPGTGAALFTGWECADRVHHSLTGASL